jgi:hypothetical protein
MLADRAIGAAGEHRCWELADLDGKPDDPDDDGSTHYKSADAAWKAYQGRYGGDRDPDDPPAPTLLPRELDIDCLTAVAVCGTELVDRDNEWVIHHPDRQDLLTEALAQGWTLLDDGSMTCAGCEHCAAVLAGHQPPPPILPGQLDLFTDGGPPAGAAG